MNEALNGPMNISQILKQRLGAVMLTVVIVAVSINVYINHRRVSPGGDDGIRIRISHWHLEAEEGFRRVIEGFEKEYFKRTGRRVTIEQVTVPYTGYMQFMNTGLIGKMAPDIIQLWSSSDPGSINKLVRYFKPLGEHVRQPNPFNEGTPLEELAWKNTFIDELRGTIQPQLQEYFAIPLSLQTTRVFYNKTLFEKIVGPVDFPTTYQGFVDLCQAVADYHRKNGGPALAPIAACDFQEGMFGDAYREAFLFDVKQKCDFNFDGNADELETAWAYGELWHFQSPSFLYAWECLGEITQYFMPGWVAAARDDMMFAFVQERALMTLTFGYDVKMISQQVDGRFELGIARLALPLDHPIYGELVKGPRSEVGTPGGNPLAITRETPHFDVCLAFLQYATSPEANSLFNEATMWLPMVKEAGISDTFLEPFLPETKGYMGQFKHGGEFGGEFSQFRAFAKGIEREFSSGKLTPEEYGKKLAEAYESLAGRGVKEVFDNRHRLIQGFDRYDAALMLIAFAGPENERANCRSRLPSINTSIQKQLFEFNAHKKRQRDKVEQKP